MTGARMHGAMEPLSFAVLSGLTPPGVEQVLYDECVEPIPLDEPTDLVAISAATFTARRAYQIALQYRRRGVPVVMGGYQPTLQPREALRFADAIVVGEAEGVWPELIEDFRAGRLRRVYSRPLTSLAGIRYDRELFAGKPYVPIRLVQFGRGCRFACDFCSIPKFFPDRRLQRPVGEVVQEIERLDPRHVFFVDDNLHVGWNKTRELVDALVPLGIRWTCQASIDIAADADLVRRMARSGCFAVLMGFESLRPDTLSRMRKTWHRGRSQYEEVVQRLHDHGILVYGTFVLGYDEDTPEVIEACLDFAERSRLFLVAFNMLTPIPDTGAYRHLAGEHRLVHDPWWLDPGTRFGHAVFEPKTMTRGEFRDRWRSIRARFYSVRGIVSRALRTPSLFRSPWRLALYLHVNFAYRSEVRRLRDLPLGDAADLTPLPLDVPIPVADVHA